ncbi:SDR family oxidoreductase [Pseudomonas sp. Irchel 3E20]|uniref:SDR family NAD(P)-dependent oxidoreductase n=1 Tax=Pseudomonas sp. Irchel 3E20 TaxID=2008983 RepID=UPI000BA32415|nr:SDR family oxidoreductase [Pseudomonas sp. Irchel 3E20]
MSARRIWLTGASSGLGAALAQALLSSGARVALSARSVEPLRALAARYPDRALLLPGDLTRSQDVRQIGERIAQAWGALDTVILNAGTCEYVDARQFDTTIIEHVVRTNLLASSYCVEVALPLLRAGTSPHLVGIASTVTYLALPRTEACGATRAGMRYLFDSLEAEWAPEGIDVTLVGPGFVDTVPSPPNAFPLPLDLSADSAARHILEKLAGRPRDITFNTLAMAELWPLSKQPNPAGLVIGKPMQRSPAPIKDSP